MAILDSLTLPRYLLGDGSAMRPESLVSDPEGCMALVLQEALLESFLIIPAQLAHLLTFVPRIMPPLVSSLQVCRPLLRFLLLPDCAALLSSCAGSPVTQPPCQHSRQVEHLTITSANAASWSLESNQFLTMSCHAHGLLGQHAAV